MTDMEKHPFFIGWQPKPPARLNAFLKGVALLLLPLSVAVAVGLAVGQDTIDDAVFEFGAVRTFSGTLDHAPVPTLWVEQPGSEQASPYILVNPLKFGFDEEVCGQYDGQAVSLEGTLVYRDGALMIEALADSVSALTEGAAAFDPELHIQNLGTVTVSGEVLDSKCYFGVMSPGHGKTHRACAMLCISGGIPPMLSVPGEGDGQDIHVLLVDKEGRPLNETILPWVARDVSVTGQAVRHGDYIVLFAEKIRAARS